jgi:hypothetical protein
MTIAMQTLKNENSDQLSDAYAKYQSECLTVDKVTVLFSGRIIFKQYIPKKYKHFGIKIYKLSNVTGSTYNMNVCLGKDRHNATQTMTAAHAALRNLTRIAERVGHKLYMDSSFSSLDTFDDLYTRGINHYGIQTKSLRNPKGP